MAETSAMTHVFKAFAYLCCCWALCNMAWADSADQTSDALAQLRGEMAALQARLDQDLSRKDEISAELATIEQELNALRKTMRETERSRLEVEATQTSLRQQLSKLQTDAQKRMTDLNFLLLKGYPIKRHSTLKLVLNQEDPQRTARVLAYHQRLTKHGLSMLKELSVDIARITETQQSLAKQADVLETLIAQQTTEVQAARELVKRREQTLAEIDRDIDQSNLALERLLEDEARLAAILSLAEERSVDEVLTDEPPDILSMKSALPMPARGEIARRYGQRRDGGHAWRGWLIETQTQAPVHAVASGRVVYANWLRGYGLLLIIDHQDQVLSLYAHNETLFFEVGDWVRQGAQIATAGQPRIDPLNNRSGIYFELRESGEPQDPAAWLDSSRLP